MIPLDPSYRTRGARLEDPSSTPALFAIEGTKCLPEIVGVGENNGLVTGSLNNRLDSSSLVVGAWASITVALTRAGPSGLQVDTALARAEAINNLELGGNEAASLGSSHGRVEEGVDVAADNVNDLAEDAGILLPDIQRLRGGDWTRVAGTLEG